MNEKNRHRLENLAELLVTPARFGRAALLHLVETPVAEPVTATIHYLPESPEQGA